MMHLSIDLFGIICHILCSVNIYDCKKIYIEYKMDSKVTNPTIEVFSDTLDLSSNDTRVWFGLNFY